MKDITSLADCLHSQATNQPGTPALISGEEAWSYAEVARLSAIASDTCRAPRIVCGSSQELALEAYRCIFEKRPFWPVDRVSPKNQRYQAKTSLPAEAALIISTSGSEGEPRAVVLSHQSMLAAANASNLRLPLAAGDTWLNCLPLYHIGGQSILWRCALAGATVLLHNGFQAEHVAVDLKKYPISHISLVPAMLARLLEVEATVPASLRHVLVGGAALSPTLYEKACAAGWPIFPSYGMSETSAQIATYNPADDPWHPGLVGRPLEGSEVAISPNGRIRIRSPQLMLGYLNGYGLDADGWLTTGDLGWIDPHGRLTVTGRADDMLISGGRNVHPLEVESCLAACPGIRDVAVTGQPEPVWGQIIVALIVGTASTEQIIEHARQHLPSAAMPRKLVFLDRLPRNPTGKLLRTELHRLALGSDT